MGVFHSLSSDSNSTHSVYFSAKDPLLELPQTSKPQELPTSTMSSECVSTLEQASLIPKQGTSKPKNGYNCLQMVFNKYYYYYYNNNW